MHIIISILIGIVFFFLLAKALVETVWGTCLFAYGIGCSILACILRTIAKIIRLIEKIRRKTPVAEEPQRISIVNGFARAHSQRPEQTDRLSPAPRNRKSRICLKQH